MRIYHSLGAGGVITRRELLGQGSTRRQIEQAERDGTLLRVDRSRFALPDALPDVVEAARADATVTCLSALRVHGVWTLPSPGLHLRRGGYGARKRVLPPGAVLCSSPAGPTRKPLDDVLPALSAVIRHHSQEQAIVALDSVLFHRVFTRAELEAGFTQLGVKARALLARADARTESPLESLVRQRLRAAGLRPRPQVRIPRLGRVDFLVGNRLIIEVDGREFHTADHSFDEDRRRDRVAASLGYVVIRLTWTQVLTDWAAALSDILAIVQRRRHRA